MDLQNIQEQLNTEFSKGNTRIIFWFDDKGEYEDEVSELQLDNVKLRILDGTNWFYSKWLLNESDTESKYLVYAPFPKPSDAENPLADMYYYSVPYYTDRVSQMSQEIGIDNRFKEHLAQYSNFWKNKNRIEKFKELGIDHFNVETIDIGLIAVLTDVKTPNFEEITRQLLLNDSETYMKALEDNGLLEKFWELCEKYFGYQSENPNVDDLAACMLLTYASVALKDALPAVLKSYVLKKKNDVVVFVRNLMDNVLYQDAYDVLAEKVDKTLRVVSRIGDELKKDANKSKDQSAQLLDIANCDAFQKLDNILIDWALDQLNDEILDAQIDGMNLAQIAEQRTAKSCHFGSVYKNEYQAIKYAYQIMKAVSVLEVTSDIKVMVADYRKQTYLVDSYYRWFYSAYDCIEDAERFSQVRERIENMYSFTYLQKVTPKLHEFDKVSYDREICAYSNKRFLLTTQKVNEPGMKSRLMAYMNNLYVTTPIGADIFKVAGGGQNYVHGGSSLQEMLIPVIELTTNTRAVAYDYVDVILTSVNRKVTNLITYFDFIQTEKVTDTMKARSLVAYFTTEEGEKISFDVPIVANSREDAPEKRTSHEKFTLKSREYKYGDKYYLVLSDANDEKNILQKYEFMIDIAFVDDFGF